MVDFPQALPSSERCNGDRGLSPGKLFGPLVEQPTAWRRR